MASAHDAPPGDTVKVAPTGGSTQSLDGVSPARQPPSRAPPPPRSLSRAHAHARHCLLPAPAASPPRAGLHAQARHGQDHRQRQLREAAGSAPAAARCRRPLTRAASSLARPSSSSSRQGVVFEAKILETGETVAIKKVLQDKRFKNRELQVRGVAAPAACARSHAPHRGVQRRAQAAHRRFPPSLRPALSTPLRPTAPSPRSFAASPRRAVPRRS
jgi:hypothetical protein